LLWARQAWKGIGANGRIEERLGERLLALEKNCREAAAFELEGRRVGLREEPRREQGNHDEQRRDDPSRRGTG